MVTAKVKNFKKTRTLLNAYVKVTEDKSSHVYKYGYNNRMPNDLLMFVNESGTAKKCISKVARYTIADGFVNESQNDLKIGDTTAGRLLKFMAFQAAWFGGVALHIGRYSNGTIRTVKPVAFNNVRRKSDGSFIVNDTLDLARYDKSKDIVYAPFEGFEITPEKLAEQIQNHGKNGEILYHFNVTPDCTIYPVPDYYAGIEDIRSSAEIQKYDLEAIYNGFVPSGILTVIGGLDDVTKDKSGLTERDYFDASLNSFTGNSKTTDGLSGRAKLMVIEASTKEEAPILQTYDAKAVIDASNTKREVIDRAVCRVMGVHPVLIGFADAAILGNRQAMANASSELAKSVVELQSLICEALNMITNQKFELTQYNPIQFIPSEVLAVLTEDELRALGGYGPKIITP